MLAVGSSLAMPRGPAPRAAPVPIDLSRPLEELLGGVELDIVHVHDPFAPSAASVALRHSRSLNVGSFHEPSERILSTQVARPLVEIFFGRLDARTASCRTTSALMERFFPGTYELVDARGPTVERRAGGRGPGRARPARIASGRADRVLPAGGAWCAAALPAGASPPAARTGLGGRDLLSGQDEVRIARGCASAFTPSARRETSPEQLIAAADIVCVASGGPRLAPGLVRRRSRPGRSRLPAH